MLTLTESRETSAEISLISITINIDLRPLDPLSFSLTMASAIPKSGITRQIMLLNKISNGPGALRLPAAAKALDLQFFTNRSDRNNATVSGAAEFWKENLPQIQFYNPGLAISVREFRPQDADKGRKSFLKLTNDDGSVKQFDVRDKTPEQILESLRSDFGAQEVDSSEIRVLKVPGDRSL